MENKFLIAIVILLLIGDLFLVGDWFDNMKKLKDPCGECVKIKPEFDPCINREVAPGIEIKINFSEVG